MDNAIQTAASMFQSLKQNFGNAFNQVGSAIAHIAQPIEQGVSSVAQGIEGDIQKLPQSLPDITSSFFNNPNVGYQNIKPVADTFYNIASQVPSLADQALKQITPQVTPQRTKQNGLLSSQTSGAMNMVAVPFQQVGHQLFPGLIAGQTPQQQQSAEEFATNFAPIGIEEPRLGVSAIGGINDVTARAKQALNKAVPNTKGLLPFGDTKGIEPDAAKTVQGMMPKIQENRVNYDNSSYLADKLLPEKDWNTFLDKHPEINNHGDTYADIGKGPEPLRELNGYIGYISTDRGTIPLDPKQSAAVIDNRVATQWTANNGDQELAIVRRNPDMPTAYDIIDRHHGIPAARALGVDKVPAIILHKDAPLLSDVYAALKSESVKPVDIKGGFDLESQTQEQQGLKEQIGGEAALTPDKIKELAPELTTDKGKAKVQGILDKAKNAQPALDESFQKIAESAGLNPFADFESRVKAPDTFVQKVAQHRLEGTEEYSAKGVNDPYGGRFIANTPQQKGQIISAINDMERNGELKILKQQQVTKDTYSAYHIDFVKDGVRGELQVHDPNSFLESIVNHEIRAQAGEKPPPELQAEKEANAQATAQMPQEQAQTLAQGLQDAKAEGKTIPGFEKDMGVVAKDQKTGNTPGYVPPTGGGTKNQVNLKISGSNDTEKIQSAIVNSERISNEIKVKGKDAYIAGTKISPNDLKLAEQWQPGEDETPTTIAALSQQAENPKAFTNFMQKITDYYDFRIAADHAVGGDTPVRENYLRQRWNLFDPQKLAEFNELATQRGVQKWNGYSNQPRVFYNYAEGEAKGFTRLNENILGDLKDDYGGASYAISRQALKQGLTQAVPDKVSSQGVGSTPEGKAFINSNIPGLEGMSFHPDVNKRLQGYQPLTTGLLFQHIQDATRENGGNVLQGTIQGLKDTGALDTIASLYDKASGPMKRMLLSMSGFHSINISGNYTGSMIFNPIRATTGLLESIPSYVSERATQGIINSFKSKTIEGKDYSVFDAGLRAGVKMDRELPNRGLAKLNPFSEMQKAMFDRELYTLKLNLVDQVFGSGKIDPESFQGGQAGQEIEKIIGEMNPRTMNLNPNTMKLASRVFLAPQFTLSKASMLKDALTKGGDAGELARRAVLGKTILFGTLATLGTKLATGQYPNLQQIMTNYSTNPTIQTDLTNPKGHKQDVVLPQTFISEFSKPVLGLLQGDTTNLQHYGQARLNPILSGAQGALTGKDYYGNNIVNPQSKTPAALQMAQNIGTSKLPIGVQNVVNMQQGKITPQQAAIQIAGLRTTTNAQDPTMKYFASLKATHDSLKNPNDQTIFDSLHPQSKDNFGNPMIDKTIRMTPDKYDVLLHHPDVMKAEVKFQQSQPNHDPLWDLPAQYRNLVMAAADKLPGQKSTYSAMLQQLPWYKQFLSQRSQWALTLPQQTATGGTGGSTSIPYPTADSQTQALMNAKQWNAPQVQNYFHALDAYNNQQLQAMGLPPTAGATGAKSYGSSRAASSRLPIKGGGGTGSTGKLASVAKSSGGKMLAGGTLGKGMLAIQARHQATMQAHAQAKAKAPKVSFGGGTKGAIKGLSAKVGTTKMKQPTLQAMKQLPIQKVNLKRLGGGQHSKTYGKYNYV